MEMAPRIRSTAAATLLAVPRPVVEWALRRRPVQRDGQRLDPQVQYLLGLLAAARVPPLPDLGVEGARAQFEEMRVAFREERPSVGRTEELCIAGQEGPLRARLYAPAGRAAGQPPALVYFHGGGFVVGSLASADCLCRLLCRGARCVVVSIDYRLAPEAPFPAGPEDALAAYVWVARNAGALGVDPERVAVGGDSAGGNLAAVTCLLARDRDLPGPSAQLLIYPMTDEAGRTRSREELREGFFLTGETMDWFRDSYLAGHDAADPMVSPLRWAGHAALPRAVIATAGFDPLRDEGQAYAQRLRDAGIEVEDLRFPSLPHGFVGMTGAVAAARAAVDEIARHVGHALRPRRGATTLGPAIDAE